MIYKAPKLTQTFVEVDANDNFLREMKDAAGNDGVHVTEVGRALPLGSEESQFNKSRFFMVFTGSAENGQTGKPNAEQREVMSKWGARDYGADREAWEISRTVATRIADKVETQPSTMPYEGFAQSNYD